MLTKNIELPNKISPSTNKNKTNSENLSVIHQEAKIQYMEWKEIMKFIPGILGSSSIGVSTLFPDNSSSSSLGDMSSNITSFPTWLLSLLWVSKLSLVSFTVLCSYENGKEKKDNGWYKQ